MNHRIASTLVIALLLVCPCIHAQESTPDRIPEVVMNTLKEKFPQAEISKWTKATEGNIVVYDIEFTQDGKSFEADIKEDGTIHNWEQAIDRKDLPKAVSAAVKKKYPKAGMKQIMLITAVEDGKETPEGYEIILTARAKGEVELTVAPDGRIVEDSSDRK